MYNAEQLTRIIKQIRDRKDIRESTKNMRILTTLGTLHEAIRAISTVDDSKPYQYAPNVHRGLHGTNAPNSYPPEFKAKTRYAVANNLQRCSFGQRVWRITSHHL